MLARVFQNFLGPNRLPGRVAVVAAGECGDGWKWERLDKHAYVTKGLSYNGDGLCEYGGLPMHNLNSVYEGGGYKHPGLKRYKGDYKGRHLCFPGEVIVANTEQGFDELLIGSCAIVPERYGASGLFTHHLYRVNARDDSTLTNQFIYLALQCREFRENVLAFTNGTTVNGLERAGLEELLVPVPPRPVMDAFEAMVSPMFQRLESCEHSADILRSTRELLLPRLLSGEVHVPEVEHQLEAAL